MQIHDDDYATHETTAVAVDPKKLYGNNALSAINPAWTYAG